MKNSYPPLVDRQILIVEDETIIAMMMQDLLEDFGCLVALAPGVEQALAAVRARVWDGVLLDMNVQGTRPVAVADELVSRGVPFLLVTGYEPAELDTPVFKTAPRLQKPFTSDALAQRMLDVFVRA